MSWRGAAQQTPADENHPVQALAVERLNDPRELVENPPAERHASDREPDAVVVGQLEIPAPEMRADRFISPRKWTRGGASRAVERWHPTGYDGTG